MNITVRMSVTDGDPNGIGTAEIANRTVQATSMPSMWSIASEHGDLTTREAYTLAYRSLGHDVHGSARAFQRGSFSICDDGGVRFEDAVSGEYLLSTRALNATTFASSLCIVSEPLGIDALDHASTIKSLLLTATT